MRIFVSIAAYRDPELLPTLEDCLRRARHPESLRFGICRQFEAGEPPLPALGGDRLRVIQVPWRESQGACWARAAAMQLYDGEDFFLQLDSHHRFVQDWDAALLDQAEKSGAARPLLTTYLPAFDPARPLPARAVPTRMKLDAFSREGIATFGFEEMPHWTAAMPPVRARFLSGHMLFTLGRFVTDVPYDPQLYFIGEEITLAARAFTHGYDLFHPAAEIGWHEYTRAGRTKHWDDHVQGSGVAQPWHVRDAAARTRAARFLTHPHIGELGCGEARTFGEYETYAGVNFRRRAGTGAARRGDEPAPPAPPTVGGAQWRRWSLQLDIDRASLPVEALDHPRFWFVAFRDDRGIEIHREDASRAELAQLLAQDGPVRIARHFSSQRRPTQWTVWPTDKRGHWLARLDGLVDKVAQR